MHMSGAYLMQDFYKDEEVSEIRELDCRHIAGTNCYCDDEAKEKLRQILHDFGPEGLHFLDSGNYHYLSLLWLEKIKEPFSLVVFDHHPDMQVPSFGEITSCGGWVREALLGNHNLLQVYLAGVDETLLQELGLTEDSGDERIHIGLEGLTDGEERQKIYISFDKDVMTEDYARCDWDQGEMALPQILQDIASLCKRHSLIGMDVCGEDAGALEQGVGVEEIAAVNNDTNRRILQMYREMEAYGTTED